MLAINFEAYEPGDSVFKTSLGIVSVSDRSKISISQHDIGVFASEIIWSPSGESIVLQETGVVNTRQYFLRIYDVATAKVSSLVSDLQVLGGSTTWSKNSDSVYFAERDGTAAIRLWKVGVANKVKHLLLDLKPLHMRIERAVVSPDGDAVLLVRKCAESQYELSLLDMRTKKWWVLATGKFFSPEWSPDGHKFAAAVNGNLWIISRETLEAHQMQP
jgi:Tol biopolymer transport system component